jgi:ABC-type transport system involved in cytochrome c biogenesis permease subunit
LVYLIQERRLKRKGAGPRWLPGSDTPLDTIDQIALKTLLFGLPCMTAGLLVGSVLAQEEFGASYFSDPKILLAFAMWIAYVAMIQVRTVAGLRGRRAVYLASFVFLVVLAVWAANNLSAVHRFTTP